jgi:hypothetical protein
LAEEEHADAIMRKRRDEAFRMQLAKEEPPKPGHFERHGRMIVMEEHL